MICSLQQNWCLGWTKVENVLLVLRLHDGQTPPTWKLNSRIFPSPELTLLLFKMFLRWCILYFCFLNWKILRLKKRKGAINFPSISIFKLINTRRYPHELFRKTFLRQGFLSFGLFVEVFCCMLDQFFCATLTAEFAVRRRLLLLACFNFTYCLWNELLWHSFSPASSYSSFFEKLIKFCNVLSGLSDFTKKSKAAFPQRNFLLAFFQTYFAGDIYQKNRFLKQVYPRQKY